MDIERSNTPRTAQPYPRPVTDLRAEIDRRDETIRLLNEALSRALDELDRGTLAAA